MKKRIKTKVVIFRDKSRDVTLRADSSGETIWATQAQIAKLFNTQRPAITKHIGNIFKIGELDKNQVSSILEQTARDGKIYEVVFYNLDMILSIGYRVNSKQATQFRIWATKILRRYILKGYSINEKRLKTAGTLKVSDLDKTIELITSVREKVKIRSK